MTKTDFGSKILLYAHPSFQGREWYDWVYVHFKEINASGDAIKNYYPATILGFVTINNFTEERSSTTESQGMEGMSSPEYTRDWYLKLTVTQK